MVEQSFNIAGIQIENLIISIVVVIVILWRISCGYREGIIAEALSLASVIASFVIIYYTFQAVQKAVTFQFGDLLTKIIYLIGAFVIYKVIHSLIDSFRRVRDVPIIGLLNSLMGALLGIGESYVLIRIFKWITGIDAWNVMTGVVNQIASFVR